MKCPFCNKVNTRVIDSRPADDNTSIRRRRQCDDCHRRFTTYEKVESIPLVVIKKDNNREPYDRAKIEAGVFRSATKDPYRLIRLLPRDEVETTIFNMEDKKSKSYRRNPMDRLKFRYYHMLDLLLFTVNSKMLTLL